MGQERRLTTFLAVSCPSLDVRHPAHDVSIKKSSVTYSDSESSGKRYHTTDDKTVGATAAALHQEEVKKLKAELFRYPLRWAN